MAMIEYGTVETWYFLMIIEITQKLSEFNSMLDEIVVLYNDPNRNINDLLELMAKVETRMMDFSLLFKRLDIIKKRYERLSNQYIKDILPVAGEIVKGD